MLVLGEDYRRDRPFERKLLELREVAQALDRLQA
jgi:hypothetical protein